jgi:all-trans-8'-apo-beta-carotenal 15,15'-oxygenase
MNASPMTVSLQTSDKTKTDWSNAFAQPIREFALTPLNILSGSLPSGLRGSLYRNGPSLFERKGERIAHWFDGDGAVLGVHFDGQNVQGAYRRVQTAGYLAEEAAGEFKFSGYGRRAEPFWRRSPSEPKNAANTSVLALEDRLLALWEGGHPHALDLKTLETIGIDNLQSLEAEQTFSAHPKVDPQTDEIYNFGVTFGKQSFLNLYKCDRQGKLLRQGKILLKGTPLIHDFVMAGPYLVFFISPVYLDVLPLLLRLKSYSEALRWRPERETQVLIVNRETLEPLQQGEADPWFQWHYANGFVDQDGKIIVDVVRYADFQTNQFFKEVPSGHPKTSAPGALWRMRVNPQTATVEKSWCLDERTCEFPTVSPASVGKPSRYTYLGARSDQSRTTDLFDALACFDHQQETLTLTDLGPGRYPSEPIFAPDPHRADKGWILSVVYNAQHHASELWIFESDALGNEPLCRVALPEAIAFSFHGTWHSKN